MIDFQKLLKEYQSILNLTNWDIELIEEERTIEEGMPGDRMTIMTYNDFKAIITIRHTLSKTEKIKTLIHELVHLMRRDELDIADDNLTDYARDIYARFYERTTEQFAKVIYKLTSNMTVPAKGMSKAEFDEMMSQETNGVSNNAM